MKHTNNERIKKAWNRYCDSSDVTLKDVYGKYSTDKADAYKSCVEFKESLNGEDMRICSYSAWIFTVGFKFKKDGKNAFCFISPKSKTWAYIEDLG